MNTFVQADVTNTRTKGTTGCVQWLCALACVRPQPSRIQRGPRRLRFRGVDLWLVSVGSLVCWVATRGPCLLGQGPPVYSVVPEGVRPASLTGRSRAATRQARAVSNEYARDSHGVDTG